MTAAWKDLLLRQNSEEGFFKKQDRGAHILFTPIVNVLNGLEGMEEVRERGPAMKMETERSANTFFFFSLDGHHRGRE